MRLWSTLGRAAVSVLVVALFACSRGSSSVADQTTSDRATHSTTGTAPSPALGPNVRTRDNPDSAAGPNEAPCGYAADGDWSEKGERGYAEGAAYPPAAAWGSWRALTGAVHGTRMPKAAMVRTGRCISSAHTHYLLIQVRNLSRSAADMSFRLVTRDELVGSCPVEFVEPDSTTYEEKATIEPNDVWTGGTSSYIYNWPAELYPCIVQD